MSAMRSRNAHRLAVEAILLITMALCADAFPTREVESVLATAASVADVQHGPFSVGWNASASTSQLFQPIDTIVKHTKTNMACTVIQVGGKQMIVDEWATVYYGCTKCSTTSGYPSQNFAGTSVGCGTDTFGVDPCPGSTKYCFKMVPSVVRDCLSYNVSEMQSGSPTGTVVGCDATLQTLVEAQTYGSAASMLLSVRGSPAAIHAASAQASSTTQSVGVEVRVTPSALVSALKRTIEYSTDSVPGRSKCACVASVGSGGVSTVVAEWFGDREHRLLSAALGAWGGSSASLLSTVHANVTLASQAESTDGVALLHHGGSAAATLHVSNVNLTRVHSLLSGATSVKLVVALFKLIPSASVSATATQAPNPTASTSLSDSVAPSVSTHATPSITHTSAASPSLHSASSPASVSASLFIHPVKATRDAAHVAAGLIGSEAVAIAIVRSGAASAAVASIAAMPSAATYASRVGSLAKVVDCGFASDIEADAVPDPFEHPFYFALGSSNLRHYAGGAVLTLLQFILLPCVLVAATHWLLGEAPQDHPTLCPLQRYVWGVLASLCFAYFGPGVVSASVMLISFGDHGDLFVGVLLFAAVIAAWCALIAGLLRLPLRAQAGGRAAWDFRRRLCLTMWIFAEGAAQLSRMTSRLYYVEEVFISCAFAALVHAPSIRGSCTPVALAVIVLCGAHVAFQALCRPYKALLDATFSIAAGVLQLLLAIVNFALVQGAGGAADDIAGCLVLALSCLFFVQAAIGGAAAFVETSWRRRRGPVPNSRLSDEEGSSDSGCGSCNTLSVPMAANPLIDAASQQRREE